jgi:hypothetical protein
MTMIRHCDGNDPNLVMYVDEHGKRVPYLEDDSIVTATQKPCDCGKVFDDVKFMVVHPHRSIK